MMKLLLKSSVCAAIALLLTSFQVSYAGTIIKLSLGSDPAADYQFSGGVGGVLTTIPDGNPGTPGQQDTAVEFLDFLSGFPNIPAGASYTLSGMTALVPPTVGPGTLVVQDLAGGSFQIWDQFNSLLLDANLTNSSIVGFLGNPSGGVISTTFGSPVAGPLAAYIVPGSVSISIALSDIKSGVLPGFVVGPGGLAPFTSDASKTIAADWTGVPEPTGAVLLIIGMASAFVARRRAC